MMEPPLVHKPVVLRVRTTMFLKKKGDFFNSAKFSGWREGTEKHVSSIKSNRNISTNCGKHTHTQQQLFRVVLKAI